MNVKNCEVSTYLWFSGKDAANIFSSVWGKNPDDSEYEQIAPLEYVCYFGEAARAPDGRTRFQVSIHRKAFQFASANPPQIHFSGHRFLKMIFTLAYGNSIAGRNPKELSAGWRNQLSHYWARQAHDQVQAVKLAFSW